MSLSDAQSFACAAGVHVCGSSKCSTLMRPSQAGARWGFDHNLRRDRVLPGTRMFFYEPLAVSLVTHTAKRWPEKVWPEICCCASVQAAQPAVAQRKPGQFRCRTGSLQPFDAYNRKITKCSDVSISIRL